MYLEILAIVILLAGALLHFKAGVWSAVMSLWMIIVSGAVAMGFYLPLRNTLPWGDTPQQMGYYWIDGLVLILLFVVTLGLLRLFGAKTLRQRMKLPALADTVGGALVGALAGYVAAGIVVLTAQMMPMPPSVLGYQPFNMRTGEREQRMSLGYDDTILGLYSRLSRGALSADATGLPGRFPNRFPARAIEASDAGVRLNPYRGNNHEDILYEYFRRRVNLALMLQKETEPMKTDEVSGVLLQSGQGTVLKADRAAQPLWVRVHDAWVVPAMVLTPSDQLNLQEPMAVEPANLTWVSTEGEVEPSAEHALLMVDVSFRPGESELAMLVQLDEWRLSSNLATSQAGARGAARLFFDHPRPKLVGIGQWNAVENRLEVQAQQADLLQQDSVNYELPGSDDQVAMRDQQKVFIAADEATWEFADGSKTARATLVFMVPALSQPWNYALRYGSGSAVAGAGGGAAVVPDVGLYRNVVTEMAPIKVTVYRVDRSARIEGLDLEPLPVGQSYLTVDLRVDNMTDDLVLLRAEDLLLSYRKGPGQPGMLLEKLSAPRKGQPLRSDIRVGNAVVHHGEGSIVKIDNEETSGMRISKDWSCYMRFKANGTLRLVYIFPAVAALTDFEFSLAGPLTGEAPQWYRMQESKPVRNSNTHGIMLGDVKTSNAERFLLDDGRTRMQRLEIGPQEYLIVPLKLRPLKSDDKEYYYLLPAEATIRLTEAGRWIDLAPTGARVAGNEAFQRDLNQRIVFTGEETVEIIYTVTVKRGAVSINAGGRQLEVAK